MPTTFDRAPTLAAGALASALLAAIAAGDVPATVLAERSRPLLGLEIEAAEDGRWQVAEDSGVEASTRRGALTEMLAHRLDLLAQRHGSGGLNVPFWTCGGQQVWADEFWSCGWRIQANHWSGHCRLLDPGGVRRAWGSYEACRVAFERERLGRDLRRGSDHLVVVLHGIAAMPRFGALVDALRADGYDVAALRYPSTRRSLAAHAEQIGRVLERADAYQRVSFVTHSMGALVLRTALARPAPWRERIAVERAVLVFPPNRGAVLADQLHGYWPYRVVLGPAGQELTTASAARVPVPPLAFAVIAGGRGDGEGRNPWIPGDDDRTVAVEETRLEQAEDFAVFDVEHTFGLDDRDVVAAALRYLRSGRLIGQTDR